MPKILVSAKNFLLDIFFPQFCINCGREGSCLCQDCLSLIDIAQCQYCPFCNPAKIVLNGKTCAYHKRLKNLNGLYSAVPYQNSLARKALLLFKYPPFVKKLSEPLAFLIITHFQMLANQPDFSGFILMPTPLHKKKLKERGYNQSQELAIELAKFLEIPVRNNILIKTKQTYPQVELTKEERAKNIKGAFKINLPQNNENILKGKKILLIDDVFTTGSTMEECARVLKQAGARQVWGVTVARE